MYHAKTINNGSLVLAHNVVLAPLAKYKFAVPPDLSSGSFAGLYRNGQCQRIGARRGQNTRPPEELSGDRPLGIQLFGDKPADLAEAARMVEGYGDLLDINMGCPVRKVVGTGAGSALLQEPLKIAAIVRAVRAATTLPLTIKIRSGWHCGDNVFRKWGTLLRPKGVMPSPCTPAAGL